MNRLWLIFLLNFSAHFSNLSANEELNPFVSFPDQIPSFFANPLEEDYACLKRPHKIEKEASNFANLDHFEPALSAECEPLATIAGCVNVVSGNFFQIEKDLKGTTIDPLDFVRYYDSGCRAESFLGFGFGSGFPL